MKNSKKRIILILIQLICLLVFLIAYSKAVKYKEENNKEVEVIESSEVTEPPKTTENSEENILSNITLSITEINEDYFLGTVIGARPTTFKVYVKLSDDYCVDDLVDISYTEMTELSEDYYELTALKLDFSQFKLDETVCYKPVIYLYPTEKTNTNVTLDFDGKFIETYPEYLNGWNVTALPNGQILDNQNKQYPYLFWEAKIDIDYNMNEGFCIKGNETKKFLEDKLNSLGLNKKEINDFTQFWVPFMKNNKYNKISFQTTAYTDKVKLNVNPTPDSLLRVYMVFQPLDKPIKIKEQKLDKFERKGFAVIEWGGSIIE